MGYLHLGASVVKQQDDATLYVLGTPVAGAGFETEARLHRLDRSGRLPPRRFRHRRFRDVADHRPNIATGTIAGLGNLGDETVGFYSATAQYHMPITDELSLYAGAGIGYMHVFDTVDGAVTNMTVNNAFGAVLQAGVDYKLMDNIGVFADVKRYHSRPPPAARSAASRSPQMRASIPGWRRLASASASEIG